MGLYAHTTPAPTHDHDYEDPHVHAHHHRHYVDIVSLMHALVYALTNSCVILGI